MLETGRLASSTVGLATAEAASRLKQYGYNEVPEKKASSIVRFAGKFWGLTAWMLELIILISWILHRYSDLYVVAILLFVNSLLGFLEEQRASGAVEALKQRLQVSARVLRDGIWKTVAARELVPGDTIRVRSGDLVPADAEMVAGEIGVDQSALTGESMEIEKKADDMLYSGSTVKRGEADGIVSATGLSTFFGKTTQLVQIARPKLHIEEVVARVVRWLLVIVGAMLGLALVLSKARGMDLLEILPLMLVLLLSAIPVALPAMFTISMAIGSMELSRRGVLITRLSASEDAATMNVLCVDKTGTMTMNRLSVVSVIPFSGFGESDVLLYGALASKEADQDPIDLAFISAARERTLLDSPFIQKAFIPFDPDTRKTEALVQRDDQELRVMKGAVSAIAQACGLSQEAIEKLESTIGEFAKKEYRTLAVALADSGEQPKLVGLVALYDTLRPDSKKFITELRELGVSVKMLTGDALPIAQEVARDAGLGTDVVKASDLRQLMRESPTKAIETAEKGDGFAEIYPEDKYDIVKSFQASGYIVGMTGDGVNDAPALRQAEVGIAVSNATDVAKQAASVVLTREGLSNIVDLIQMGRTVYERVTTWIINKISRTVLKSAFVVLAFLLTGKYVVSSFAMILLLFMTDFVKISLSTDNVRWSRKPDTWRIAGLVRLAVILGLLMVGESLGLLFIGLKYFRLAADDQALQTFAFEILFFLAIFSLFVVRERGHFWDSVPSKTLLTAIALDIGAATMISTFGIPGLKPIPVIQTLGVVAYSCIFSLVVNDFIKFALVKRTGVQW